jgi:hypothetical protein
MTALEELQKRTDEAQRLAAEKAETLTHDQAKAYAYGYLVDHYLGMLTEKSNEI